MSKRILVITGASGGHIFPAIGFQETLRDKQQDITTLLVCPKNSLGSEIFKNEQVRYISISRIGAGCQLKNFLAILKFLKGSLESLFILMQFKPDTVVGFGSIVSLPMVIFAWVMRIKTLIHEQNVIPGRTNRLLAKFTDSIAVSFAQTKSYFRGSHHIVLTGNPLRSKLKEIARNKALDFFGFTDDKLTILVMGGSLGSHKINTEFLSSLTKLSALSKIQVIHLTGREDYNLLKNSYRELKVEVKLFAFLSEMEYAYSASDLVLSRAGATTIAEIISFKVPAIIVPYPFAYQHQIANARVLEKVGSGIIIEDAKLNADILKGLIDGFISSRQELIDMRSAYDVLPNLDANSLLVEEVLLLN